MCHGKVKRKFSDNLQMGSNYYDVVVFEGQCTTCKCVLKEVPKSGETWLMDNGATMKISTVEPKGEARTCRFSCPCHSVIEKESGCVQAEIHIQHLDDNRYCMLCDCEFQQPEYMEDGKVYELFNGTTISVLPPARIAMIMDKDHPIFDPKIRQSEHNRRMAKLAWKQDTKVGNETYKQELEGNLSEMQRQLSDITEEEVEDITVMKEVNKPIPNYMFPYLCPPEMGSTNKLKPEKLPVGSRPKNEAERQEMLRGHFEPQLAHLQENEKVLLLGVIKSNYDRFYFAGDVLPEIEGVSMDIQLMPGTAPIKQRPRPVVHAMREKVEDTIRQFIKNGAVSPIMSPWNSPLYPVWKKNGGVRLTVDYRKLNNVTIEESYPLPRCTDLLDDLGRIKPRYFTVLDMTAGFYQIPMSANARRLTAWSTFSGQFCFNRVAMGLKNSPMVFQRTMERVLRDVDPEQNRVRWYIDDILVCSNTVEEHAELLEKLFKRMREVNLTCEFSKCDLAKREVIYLGYQIGRDGLAKNSCKTKCVEKYPVPEKVKELRSFLGLCSFFRRFIEKYAARSRSLYELTRVETKWTWGEVQQAEFEDLKRAICDDVVLAYPDFENKDGFVIQTDGSYSGLGGMLAQVDELGRLRPIAFASRALRGAEKNYTVSEIEMLGVVFCLTQFKQYVLGYPIVIETDHQALCSLMAKPSLNARIQRWTSVLSMFNPKIKYKKGVENKVADVLSRMFEGLDPDGARYSELQKACNELHIVEGRISHPDAILGGLIDSPQYTQITQSKVLNGQLEIVEEGENKVFDPDVENWTSLSEMEVYNLGEQEEQYQSDIMGIDFDMEGAVMAMCTGTCPGIRYGHEKIGFREHEQEDIWKIKNEGDEMYEEEGYFDGRMASDEYDSQGMLRYRVMAALTRQAITKEKEERAKKVGMGDRKLEKEGDEVVMADGKLLRIRNEREEVVQNGEAREEVGRYEEVLDELEREEGEAEREVVNHVALGQSDDEAISAIIARIQQKGRTVIITDRSWYAFFKSNRQNLFVSSRNILYIKPKESNRYKVFVPESVVPFLMLDTHEGMGHPSVDRMMGLLEPYVYWRQMRKSVKLHVRRCMICATRQGQGQLHRAPMTSIQVEAVKFGRVFADVVKLGESRMGFKYILTVVDNFTKWVECYPMRTQTAQETTYRMEEYIRRWDMVRSLLTDNGANFKSEVFETMLKEKGVKHLYTSPYWPQGDGLSERTHRTILNMLSKHCSRARIDWCEKLQEVVMWHNKMPNKSTGQVPYTLVHCYPPTVVPGSSYLRTANFTVNDGVNEDLELKPEEEMFELAKKEAIQCLEAASLLRKVYYDKSHKTKVVLTPGQRVFRMYPPARKGRIYKLSRVYCGPFRLLQVRENGSALIKRVDKLELPPVRVNVGHLTHCYGEVPTNKFWNGNTLVVFKENEVSVSENIVIKKEWLIGEKVEEDSDIIEHSQ